MPGKENEFSPVDKWEMTWDREFNGIALLYCFRSLWVSRFWAIDPETMTIVVLAPCKQLLGLPSQEPHANISLLLNQATSSFPTTARKPTSLRAKPPTRKLSAGTTACASSSHSTPAPLHSSSSATSRLRLPKYLHHPRHRLRPQSCFHLQRADRPSASSKRCRCAIRVRVGITSTRTRCSA